MDSLNSFVIKSNQKFKISFEREIYTGEEQLGIYIRVDPPRIQNFGIEGYFLHENLPADIEYPGKWWYDVYRYNHTRIGGRR